MNTSPVLVVIDVQDGFHNPSWGPSNNPECETNIRSLLDAWRAKGLPVVLVRHDSVSPGSTLRPDESGNRLQDGIAGPHDLFITKSVNSAFYGEPNLQEWLQAHEYSKLVICGITTNFCCETTARMAGNLGYDVDFVLDATRAFDMVDLDGHTIAADQVARMTAANLDGEFAHVVSTTTVLASIA